MINKFKIYKGMDRNNNKLILIKTIKYQGKIKNFYKHSQVVT